MNDELVRAIVNELQPIIHAMYTECDCNFNYVFIGTHTQRLRNSKTAPSNIGRGRFNRPAASPTRKCQSNECRRTCVYVRQSRVLFSSAPVRYFFYNCICVCVCVCWCVMFVLVFTDASDVRRACVTRARRADIGMFNCQCIGRY